MTKDEEWRKLKSPLTAGAVIRRALPLHACAYRRAETKTRLIRASIAQKVVLEMPRLSVAADVIAQTRAAGIDRKRERFLDLDREHLAAGEADAPRRRLRIDAGAKQRFAGVDIADPGDQMAVHQRLLDRNAAVARLVVQPRAVEPGAERLGTDALQQRVRQRV